MVKHIYLENNFNVYSCKTLEENAYSLIIVDLYKKQCNGYTYISPTAGNFIMYKNREIKIEKSDDFGKIVRKTNLIKNDKCK